MRKIIGANDPFVREDISREDAQQRFAENEYKLENIAEIPEGEVITTYSHGKFTDLCEGPHVERAGAIKAVKLLNIAGAYWRGDERNPMLQRIYGTAFESKDALRQHIEMLEEAAKRDHRKVGRELELFMFDPAAPASPFFLPKGTVLYNLLIDYIRELYQRLRVPGGHDAADLRVGPMAALGALPRTTRRTCSSSRSTSASSG